MRQFWDRARASGQSAVESRTSAVFSAESCTAPRGVPHGADDLVELAILGEAGDGAGLVERIDLLGLRRGRENDDGGTRPRLPDRRGRLHPVQLREAVVHQDDVRLEPLADL